MIFKKIKIFSSAAILSLATILSPVSYADQLNDVLKAGTIKIDKDNPELEMETKFIVRQSPAFIGVKSGEMNMLQWVNVFVLHKKLGGDLDKLSKKMFRSKITSAPFIINVKILST